MSKNTGRVRMQKGKKANFNIKRAKTKTHPKRKPLMSAETKKARADERKALRLKVQKKVLRDQAKQTAIDTENERLRVEDLVGNEVFAEFISRNVGKKAISVIKILNAPQTDEKIAADLNLKINEVRRILNVLDSYGVARYDTNKDSKGWLTFKWYLDGEKLSELHQTALNSKPESAYKLPDNCNDFFYCGKCYEESKVILPFDAAFEAQFRCEGCGKALKQVSKEEARALFEDKEAEIRTADVV